MINYLLSERQKAEELLNKANKGSVDKLPGSFRVAVNHGNYQYYLGNEYISKRNIKLLKKLSDMELKTKLRDKLPKYISDLTRMVDSYRVNSPAEIYNSLNSGKKVYLSSELYKPIEVKIIEFMKEKYEAEPLPFEITSDIYTKRGEHVRSKSEKIIADELYARGIPYRYEKPLNLFVNGKTIYFYPDFTTMNKRTGDICYLEHLGMMDDIEYVNKSMWKLDIYEKNGILLGKNLIILRETSVTPININVMNQYFDDMLE